MKRDHHLRVRKDDWAELEREAFERAIPVTDLARAVITQHVRQRRTALGASSSRESVDHQEVVAA